MAFTPVTLIGPDGTEFRALDAIELNDLMARGFQRVEVMDRVINITPSPVPREASSFSTWNTESTDSNESPASSDES